ncbi:MAG TPA: hypothetical protein VI731_08375, partial [Bacteroidia bacterium]|nr:hypothetical protein [Bacteroidia bacterium]
ETARTLNETNNNVKDITDNLKNVTNKLDSSAFWMVMADTTVANSLRAGIIDFGASMKDFRTSFLVKGLRRDKDRDKEKEKENDKDPAKGTETEEKKGIFH